MDLFLTNTAFYCEILIDRGLINWSGVDHLWIIVMFLSAAWTLILTAPIHCSGSIGEQVM